MLREMIFKMTNDLLSVISGSIITIGTIFSILSIIKMRLSDIFKTSTIGYLIEMPIPVLEQVYQARQGVFMIIMGLFLSITSILWKEISWKTFWLIIIMTLVIIIIVSLLFYKIYQSDKIKIKKELELRDNRINKS